MPAATKAAPATIAADPAIPSAKTNIHYIPAGADFAEYLVGGVLRRFAGDGGLAAASYILLPNQIGRAHV